eukprot:12138656-Ditylum_brightwellii.AAC.1
MDQNNWSKNECFAPVMTQMEFRLLVSAAVQMGRTVKGGDFKQAFCQSYLPPGEDYILRPPKDCLFTTPNMYLKLIRTLYGLKRSPRH